MDETSASVHARTASRRQLAKLAMVLAVLIVLACAWSWSPLRGWLDLERVVAKLQQLGQSLGPLAVMLGVALALTLAVPLTFLTLVTIVTLGPVLGFFCAILAATLGAAATFGLGKYLGRDVVQRMGGAKVKEISSQLAQNGILAVVAVRMVPVAPFAIVNLVAGASELKMRDMLIGTAIGMTPGALIMVVFVDQIIAALQRPSPVTALIGALLLALLAGGVWGVKRWLKTLKKVEATNLSESK